MRAAGGAVQATSSPSMNATSGRFRNAGIDRLGISHEWHP